MFSKLAIVVAASMAAIVVAGGQGINNSCKSGPVQCCDAVHEYESEEVGFVKSLLKIDVPVNAKVGTQCSPVSVVGVGNGSTCKTQPICCTENHFEGLVVAGCSPITVQ